MKFKNDIEAQAGFKDAGGDLGAAGQLLSSTGTETNWIDQSTIASGSAEVVEVPVKNLQGSALTKGDPVYISGSVGASGILEVQLADAGNAAKMPAVGLLKQDLAANAEGFAVVTGKLRNLITSPIDGVTPNPNTVIYVKSGGSTGAALTTVKPGGSTNLIQNVGKVGRVSTSADGTLVVSSILRSNDVPNLPLGRLFVGTSANTSLTSDVVYIDDANDRVGIGTTSPAKTLSVNGGDIAVNNGNSFIVGAAITGNTQIGELGADSGQLQLLTESTRDIKFGSTTYGNIMFLEGVNGNVGIGTSSPVTKLQIDSVPANEAAILANQVYARISLGQQGNSGDAHFGASGNGAPTVGFQDYGFYAAHNAYRSSTGAWKHSRTATIPAVRLLGSGGVSSGNQGFSFDYSANVGTADITWTNLMQIMPSGNVGIGTTSPSEKLHVVGNARVTGAYYDSNNSAGTSGQVLSSTATGTDWVSLSEISGVDGTGTTNYVAKWSDTDTITDSVIYDNGTNVGIGTTSPGYKLDVNGSLHSTNLNIADAIYHEGDTNTYIQFVSNDTIRWVTNGVERMRLNSSGNVGIGTTSPSFKLDLGNSTSANNLFRLNGSNADVLFSGNVTAPSGGVGLWNFINTGTNATTRFYVQDANNSDSRLTFDFKGSNGAIDILSGTSSGNVGIGTTSPGAKLQVGDGSFDANARVFHSDSTYTEMRGYGIITNRTTAYIRPVGDKTQVLAIGNDGNTWNYINHNANYHTFSTDLAERMRIDLGGNVGIGTTSPGAKLSIGGASGELLKLDDSSATGNPFISIWQAGVRRSYIQYVDSGDNLSIASEYGGIRFLTGTGGTETEKMRILSGGNVGIGTTSPSQTLEVAGTGIKLVNAANTHTHLLLDTATYDYKLGDISTSGGAYMQILSSTNQTFIYNSDLILSNNHQVKLTRDNVTSTTADSCIYVDNAYTGFGNPYNIDSDLSSQFGSRHIGFRYNGTIVGYIGANGTTAVTYSTTSSDERLKKNIEDWQENILDKFEKIEPKKFNFISEEEGESKTKGFIAQNMAEDFPEAYPHDYSEDKYYSFNPSGMAVYLMKAVKDLVEQNKQLETRIQILEQQK